MTRYEKLRLICNYSYTYDTLHVCRKSARNCGHCDDCTYTLVALDSLGMLKRYASVFDLDDYRAHRDEAIRHVFENRRENPYFAELYRLLPDEWKSDDCVYRLSTWHATDVCLDADFKLRHDPTAEITDKHYPLYARFNGDKATLFFVRDGQIKYVGDIEDSQTLTITDAPVPVATERIFDGTIAFKRGDMYLTALPKTSSFRSRKINVVWEHYFLEEANFSYNELSSLKNFVPINKRAGDDV